MDAQQLCALTAGVVALVVNLISRRIGRARRRRRLRKARLAWEEQYERFHAISSRTLRERRDKIN